MQKRGVLTSPIFLVTQLRRTQEILLVVYAKGGMSTQFRVILILVL